MSGQIEGQAAIARVGLCTMQMCAPACYSDQGMEDAANDIQPTGIDSCWQMAHAGDDVLNGDPERVQCTKFASHVHVVLVC